MTDFSEAQFQEVVNKINGGLDDLSGKIAEVPRPSRRPPITGTYRDSSPMPSPGWEKRS